MIEFKPLDDGRLAVRHSLLVGAVVRLLGYCDEHGGIELTPNKALKRKFVNWAVIEFDWPGYTHEDLSVVNKVFNEMDFPPLFFIHQLLIDLKIGRHYKGLFKLTQAGKALVGSPARLFGIITPFFLFGYEYNSPRGREQPPPGNWDIFLNVINIEAQDSITGQELFSKFYGYDDRPNPLAPRRSISGFYVAVLRPLCWAGLLEETRIANDWFADRMFRKTALWSAALRLDTDHMIE